MSIFPDEAAGMRYLLALALLLWPVAAVADVEARRCAAPDDWEGRIVACSAVLARRTSSQALARAHLHRGEAHLALGATLEAIRDLREAVRLAPGMAAAHLALGVAYLELGRADAAERSLAEAAARAPDAPDIWYWRALAEDRLGRPEAALDALDRALAIAPFHAPARLARARLRCALGDVEGAVADTGAALESGALGHGRLSAHLAAAGFVPSSPDGAPSLDDLQRWARAGCP